MSSKVEPDYSGEMPQASRIDFPVVGLGASAGGIRALQTFFESMLPDSGLAFVVVMHLSPDHESNLAQILQQRTAMPVIQVTEAVHVAPNHVYVIPPNKHLSMQDSMLLPVEPQQPFGRRIAIDLFFRTLATAYTQRAIVIVLSGTDSDGVIGLKHVKEQGGITIAQDPTEAEFDSMPRAAIGTGMVDWILPVAQMPPRLLAFIGNEQRIHVPPEELSEDEAKELEDGNSGGPLIIRQIPSVDDETALMEVLRFLRGQTGHDFFHYKRATMLRRIARRLQVNLLEDIPTYLNFLRTHPAETIALLHDLLISVTNFFRDREAFTTLQSHIPQLFANKQASEQVRVWAAGCATGEEAYSIAILLYEHASKLDTPPGIQVFGTDLDDDAIQIARTGLYPTTIEADVSAERLRRFFQRDQGGYRVRKELRELVLFSAHNLLRDSPFSRLDLVSCRNLLIYLKREAQDGVFDIFHFALHPGGLLFLGGSENLDDTNTLFAPLDKHHHLYVRRAMSRPGWQIPTLPLSSVPQQGAYTPVIPRQMMPPDTRSALPEATTASTGITPPGMERRALLISDLHLTLLEGYAPPSVIIDGNYDVLHLSEHVGRFLQIQGGEPSMNLLKLVHPALRIELRTALFRAIRSETDVTTAPVMVEIEGVQEYVRMQVRPTRKPNAAAEMILVIFAPVTEASEASQLVLSSMESVAQNLDEEIQHLKEQLSASVEQYEASMEELKASNEELQAMNEEMRSTAEELETGKEELQSINEELSTVNHELKNSVLGLSRTNSDLENLMASTDIGTIFLDRQLHIKRFTPRVQELFNLISTDIGRPLSDITHKLNYDALAADAERVLHDLHMSEREVSSDGHWFLARLMPYRTLDDHIDGVVLAFVEITKRKRAEEQLRLSEERLRLTLEHMTDYAILTLDLAGSVTGWSEGARRVIGYESAEIMGQHFRIFYTYQDQQAQTPERGLETAAAQGRDEDEGWRVRKDGTAFWCNEITTAVHDESGALTSYVKIARDLTERRQTEEDRARIVYEATLLSERNRMAQELHDTLAQGFTGIKLQMDAAEEALQDEPEVVRRYIERTRTIAQQSLIEARNVIRALRAPLLISGSLVDALAHLVDSTTNDGKIRDAKIRFSVEGTPHLLSQMVESDLYRLAQEAVTNALRHGQPQQVTIQLTYTTNQVRLTVQDDGRGFDLNANHTGYGIIGMQERALRIGAELRITSQPGQGTQVTVTLDASSSQNDRTK